MQKIEISKMSNILREYTMAKIIVEDEKKWLLEMLLISYLKKNINKKTMSEFMKHFNGKFYFKNLKNNEYTGLYVINRKK